MKTFKSIIIIAAASFLIFSSCNPVRRVTKNLAGVWSITGFEEQKSGVTTVNAANIGTIALLDDKTGQHRISYNIFGTSIYDTTHFTWSNSENILTLTIREPAEVKAWILMVSKKNKQVWKSTDGAGNVQKMTLMKVKD